MVLAEAGIGKVNTAAVATLLAARFHARILVFSGVAGGLDPALAIGDVVIATRAIQHDCGVIEDERLQPYQAGHVPFFNPTDELGYAVEPALLARVQSRLEGLTLPPLSALAGGAGRRPRLVYGTILAGDQYIHCEATRERLQREFAAQAVAMEGGALAQVAVRLGVPWLEIRALSDLAGKRLALRLRRLRPRGRRLLGQDPAAPAAGALIAAAEAGRSLKSRCRPSRSWRTTSGSLP